MSRIVTSSTVRTFSSSSRPGVEYAVLAVLDEDGHNYLSCNCPAWTRGSSQKGKQAWERECKHTRSTSTRQVSGVSQPSKRATKAARPEQTPAPTKAEPQGPSRFDLIEL